MRKVYGAMSPSYEQNQPKRCKMHSILRTCGIVFCAGESFGVLRLETSPETFFSNDNLIKQFTTCRLAISQNIPCLPPSPLPLPPPRRKKDILHAEVSLLLLGRLKYPGQIRNKSYANFFPTVISMFA